MSSSGFIYLLTIAWHFVSRFSVLVCKATGVWSPISLLMTNIGVTIHEVRIHITHITHIQDFEHKYFDKKGEVIVESLKVIYNKIFLIIGYDYVREKVSCILTEIAPLTAGHNTGRWLPGGGGWI